MSHLDPDTLTLLALGEESERTDDHLADCGTCAADLASLRRTVTAGRAVTDADRAPAPPAHLWDRIAAELSLPPKPAPAQTNGHHPAEPAAEEPGPAPAARQVRPEAVIEVGQASAPPAPAQVAGPPDGRPPAGPRSRARASKRRRASLISAALVSVLGLGAALAFALTSSRPTVVAEVALAPLEGSSLEGSAQLVERDGALELRVDLEASTDDDRYHELWLLDTSGEGLVSLGPVTGDGVHPLPAGLTVADFPVVDVSSERFDGDPSHSGDSLSRGTLPV